MSQTRMDMNKKTYENLQLEVKPVKLDLEVIQEASESVISARELKLAELYNVKHRTEKTQQQRPDEEMELDQSL